VRRHVCRRSSYYGSVSPSNSEKRKKG
jgi:hypothetical protein